MAVHATPMATAPVRLRGCSNLRTLRHINRPKTEREIATACTSNGENDLTRADERSAKIEDRLSQGVWFYTIGRPEAVKGSETLGPRLIVV